jgi:hypothetical protein
MKPKPPTTEPDVFALRLLKDAVHSQNEEHPAISLALLKAVESALAHHPRPMLRVGDVVELADAELRARFGSGPGVIVDTEHQSCAVFWLQVTMRTKERLVRPYYAHLYDESDLKLAKLTQKQKDWILRNLRSKIGQHPAKSSTPINQTLGLN